MVLLVVAKLLSAVEVFPFPLPEVDELVDMPDSLLLLSAKKAAVALSLAKLSYLPLLDMPPPDFPK